jgi:hypothetical protein
MMAVAVGGCGVRRRWRPAVAVLYGARSAPFHRERPQGASGTFFIDVFARRVPAASEASEDT